MKELIQEKAAGYFAETLNCCQSVVLAANDIWSLEVSADLITAGAGFQGGMHSGCSCGALVGAQMILSIVQQRQGVSFNAKLSTRLHNEFKETFGSACCRVLRKKQGMMERMNNRGCKKITAVTAGILYDIVAAELEIKKAINL